MLFIWYSEGAVPPTVTNFLTEKVFTRRYGAPAVPLKQETSRTTQSSKGYML